MGREKKWTSEDIDCLEESWGKTSVYTLSEKLDRSVNAINIKVFKLGLGAFLENGDYITVNQLMQALGRNDFDQYARISWIKNRGLPVKSKTVKKCKFRVIYLSDFWKWAGKNRTFINFAKVPENSLGKEPDWVKGQRRIDEIKKMRYRITPWTKAEDEQLKTLIKQFKYSYSDISKRLQRTCGAVQRRLLDLGLKERPIKMSNHNPWSKEDYYRLGEMIKQGMDYEFMSDEFGRSSKAIRGRVYDMYLTENLDKVIQFMGTGHWGDGRPERTISSKKLNVAEKNSVKENISFLAGILNQQVQKLYGENDYWQRALCKNWHRKCLAGKTDCDSCTSFIRMEGAV